jgi:hypothetical protein
MVKGIDRPNKEINQHKKRRKGGTRIIPMTPSVRTEPSTFMVMLLYVGRRDLECKGEGQEKGGAKEEERENWKRDSVTFPVKYFLGYRFMEIQETNERK